MDGMTWVDPRYAELVATWELLKQGRDRRRRPITRCPGCDHGLGAVIMVSLKTKAPLLSPCLRCTTP